MQYVTRLAHRLTRSSAAPNPTQTEAASTLTDDQVAAIVQRAAALGYGRGGTRGCMAPAEVLAAQDDGTDPR